MSLATINRIGLYVIVTLVGMVAAALAAYYILVQFIYPLQSPNTMPKESASDTAQVQGKIESN